MSRLPQFLLPTLSLLSILFMTFWTTSLLLSVIPLSVPPKTPHRYPIHETLTTYRTPPQLPPSFPPPPSSIHAAINSSSTLLYHLSTLPPQDATFSTVLSPLAASEAVLTTLINTLTILSLVSPPSSTDTTASLLAALNTHTLTISTHPSLPPLLTALISRNSTHSLDAESARYLTSWHTNTLRDGLMLPPEQQQRLQVILAQMEALRETFQNNLIDINATLSLPQSELAGVPTEFLSTLTPDPETQGGGEQGLVLPLMPAAVAAVLSSASNPATRRKVFIANENRCPANAPVFAELVAMRAEAARLLGYGSWAELRVEGRLVPDVEFVGTFLEELRAGLGAVAGQEVAERRQVKQQDEAQRGVQKGVTEEGGYHLWDHKYVDHLLHSQQREELSFKLERVLPRVLGIVGGVFGLEFVRVLEKDWEMMRGASPTDPVWDGLRSANDGAGSDRGESAWDEIRAGREAEVEGKMVWHESVQLYAVWNSDGQERGGEFVGYLYLDLFARAGKTTQAGNLNVSPGYLIPPHPGKSSSASSTGSSQASPQSRRHYPSTAILMTFSPSGILSHAELVVLFHELGHAVHDLVSETKYARYHGPAGVAVDFAEVPSRVGEEFAWDGEVLRELGADGETASTLVKGRFNGAALSTLRGVHIASFDMAVHSSHPVEDMGALYNQLRREIIPVLGGPERMNGYATFGHLAMGYDAGYYGYLLSSCYAADVWGVFRRAKQVGEERHWGRWGQVGRRWRRVVLGAGGVQGGGELLERFLGRSAGCAGFYRRLGAMGGKGEEV